MLVGWGRSLQRAGKDGGKAHCEDRNTRNSHLVGNRSCNKLKTDGDFAK